MTVIVDPSSRLTIRELDIGSRMLRYDILTALAPGSYMRPAAMAVTAYLLARREAEDPKAVKLETYRAMTLEDLAEVLGMNEPAADDDDADEAPQDVEAAVADLVDTVDTEAAAVDGPDDLGPLDDQAALEDAIAADPTESTPGSSSPASGAAPPQLSMT